MNSVIYKILNKSNGKFYIGSAACWITRKKTHKYNLRHNKHVNTHLQNAWNKYGESNFEFIIVEEVQDKKDLLTREQFYIDLNKDGYNICKVAGNRLGTTQSVSTRNKMSESHKGIKHSDETRKLLSVLKKGVKQTPSHIANKVAKMIGKPSGNLGKFGHSNSKAILQYDLEGNILKCWNSSMEIYRETGFSSRNIRLCCSGQRNIAHGFKWKFKTV